MAKHITHPPSFAGGGCLPDWHSKGIVSVIFGCGHRQTDDQRSFFIENTWGENQKGMNIPHFLTHLRIAVNPDNVLAIRYPQVTFFWGVTFSRGRWFGSYHFSAPIA